MGKIRDAIKSTFGLAEEKHAAVQSELERQRAVHTALVQRALELTALRDAAVDDAETWAAASRDLDAAHLETGRVQRLIEREQQRLREAAHALKVEEKDLAVAAAVTARDALHARADARVRAEDALRVANEQYTDALAQAESHFAQVRALAAELGEPAPGVAARSAAVLVEARLLTSRHDASYELDIKANYEEAVRFARHYAKPARDVARRNCEQEREAKLLKALCSLYSVTDPCISQERWPNADRLALLRKDPDLFSRKCIDLGEEDRVNAEQARAKYERDQQAARDEQEKRLIAEYGMRFADD